MISGAAKRKPTGHRRRRTDMAQLFGIYQAVVVSAVDPEGQRRLLVTLPEVLGAATLLALPCVPAGSRVAPRAGTVVWVQFEAGNRARPVWIGTRPKAR